MATLILIEEISGGDRRRGGSNYLLKGSKDWDRKGLGGSTGILRI